MDVSSSLLFLCFYLFILVFLMFPGSVIVELMLRTG